MPDLIRRSLLGSGTRAKILFFGECPGDDERDANLAFVGVAGKLLRETIKVEGLTGRLVLDNVVPIHLGRDEKGAYRPPKVREINEFKEYREEVIKRWNPKIIVLLGGSAQKAFGIKGGVLRKCGDIEARDGRTFVCSVHPSYVNRNGHDGSVQWRKAFESIKVALKKGKKSKFKVCNHAIELQRILSKIDRKACCLDFETTSLDPRTGNTLCAAIAWSSKPEDVILIPLFHKEVEGWGDARNRMLALRNWWEDHPRQGPRIAHNATFENAVMRHNGCKTDPAVVIDTMLNAFLIDENEPTNLNHQVVATLKAKPYWTGLSQDKEKGYGDVPLDELIEYCGNDVHHTYRLMEHQHKIMSPGLQKIQREVWAPLCSLLLTMQERGICCDREKMKKILKSLSRKATLEDNKIERTFPGLNIRSTKQVSEVLYDKLGFRPVRKTKLGGRSADEKSIKVVAREHPVLNPILESRKHKNMHSRLQSWVDHAADGFLHTNWHCGQVTTWRLSASYPNVLNVDRKGPQREAMGSRHKGGKITQYDYGQHELRYYSVEAEDHVFLDRWKKDNAFDPHQLTCDQLLERGVDVGRDYAKNTNFGVIYDVSPMGLEDKYDIPKEQGKILLREWAELHPALGRFRRAAIKQIYDHGYVESVFGMRRHARDPGDRHEQRSLINFLIQHPAAFICFVAMLEAEAEMRKQNLKSVIDMQIHDSIRVDTHPKEVKKVTKILKTAMLSHGYKRFLVRPMKHEIPLVVDVKIGEHM